MKSEKTVDDLIRYVYKVYKEPSPWWSKAHFEKRCTQIYAAEVILLRCFDSPFSDPKDVIDGYLMEIYYAQRHNDNEHAAIILNTIEITLEELLRYLN